MRALTLLNQQTYSTKEIILKSRIHWLIWYLGLLGITGFVMLLMMRGTPNVSWLAWALFICGTALIFIQPRYGIYLTLFWGLAGDQLLMPWYPFTKNFSSRETLLYLNDAIIFSPLELFLVLTLVTWLLRQGLQRNFRLVKGQLFWPVLLFASFIVFGLVYGIARGGSANIALWESRSIFYMFLLVFLIGNLIENRSQIKVVVWVLLAAFTVKGFVGTYQVLFVLNGSVGSVESITEHSAPIHLGATIVLAAATFLFRVDWRKRIFLVVMIPPILLTILGAQRRSGYVALLVAFVLLAVFLFRERRTWFWLIVPPVALVGMIYMGIFWNNSGPLGGPAQAVKSVIAEDEADAHDRASNQYREIENFNSTFTIKQEPLTGVGFGNKFYIVIPMADISNFIWWEYIPHNSIAYIWIKSGVGGFLTLLLLLGLSIAHGVRATIRISSPFLRAIALTATIYVIMHSIYSYVDIAWEPQGMLMLGAMLGLLNCIESIVSADLPTPKRRWPWQPEPQREYGLLSVERN